MTSFHLHRFILPVLLTLHALLSRLSTVVSGWTPPNIYRRSVINSDRKYREILHLSIPFHFGNIDNFAGDASLVKSSSSSFMSKNSFDDFFEFDVPLGIEINYDIDDDDIDDDESFDDAFDRFLVSDENEDETDADDILFDPRTRNFRLVAAGSAGLSFDEIQLIFGAVKDVAEDFDVPFYPNNLFSESSNSGNDDDNVDETSGSFSEDGNNESPFVQIKNPIVTEEAQGILGRVLLLCLHDDNDIGYDVEENYSQDDNHNVQDDYGGHYDNGDDTNNDDYLIEQFTEQLQGSIAQNIDDLVLFPPPTTPPFSIAANDGTIIVPKVSHLNQPLLLVIQRKSKQQRKEQQHISLDMEHELRKHIINHINLHDLRQPLPLPFSTNKQTFIPKPTIRAEIDGEMTPEGKWDVSGFAVFDNLVSDDLRRDLLDVVLGMDDTSIAEKMGGNYDKLLHWDDVNDGPDPRRWTRGALDDVPTDDDDDSDEMMDNDNNDKHTKGSWGLSDIAISNLCDEVHTHLSILSFESNVLSSIFPTCDVTRLPCAVFGGTVSPLTANAATFGEEFSYHIDAAPDLVPPSVWTDCYGRYKNRSNGRPRFVSCVLYLNDIWGNDDNNNNDYDDDDDDDDSWEGGTEFFDPPTNTKYVVQPKPGRFVIMDQDVTHRVLPPSIKAGLKRPRYSLVWKLILHPKGNVKTSSSSISSTKGFKKWGQDMCSLLRFESGDSKKNDSVVFIGSASNRPILQKEERR